MNVGDIIMTKIVPILGILLGVGHMMFGVLLRKSWLRTDVFNKISIIKSFKLFFIVNGVNMLVAFSVLEILNKANGFIVSYVGIIWLIAVILLVNKCKLNS